MKTVKNDPLGLNKPENSFKYKFAEEDAKKSANRNANKLAALKASIERGQK